MVKFTIQLILCFSFLWPQYIFAEEKEISIPIIYEGTTGVFLPQKMAESIFSDLKELDLQKKTVGLLREETFLKQTNINILELQIENLNHQVELLEADRTLLLKEISAEKKWYQEPIFWFVSGTVAAMLLSVSSVIVVRTTN